MKPPPFEYLAPATLDEALDALAKHGDEAKVLAGGQSLVPILALRLAHPALLVDLGTVPGLGSVSVDGRIAIGATVTQRQAERDQQLRQAHPLLAEALPLIAHPQIRNRGTICGSLAHADPAAELPAVALACDATLTLQRAGATRTIGARDFFQSYLETATQADEIVTRVEFDRLDVPGTGAAIHEISRRHGDFAMAGAVAVVTLDGGGQASAIRLALFGVAATPLRATAAEASLTGTRLDEAAIADAAALASRDIDPPSDVHASGAYRRHVTGVLVTRALQTALLRAQNGLR